MKPKNWPKEFQYSSTSIVRDIHPNIFAHFLTSSNPEHLHKISKCIEKQKVHPHLQIKNLLPPHPLAKDRTRVQRGLFAAKKIPKDTELGEYTGEIWLNWTNAPVHSPQFDYTWVAFMNGFLINICSLNFANELTFVNDFRGIQDKPNVKDHIIFHRGRCYFGYVTTREILPNEELLIDYGRIWEQFYNTKEQFVRIE